MNYKINKSKDVHSSKEDAVDKAAFDYNLDDVDQKILLETGFVMNSNGTIVELKEVNC
jgi:hypothetical protein